MLFTELNSRTLTLTPTSLPSEPRSLILTQPLPNITLQTRIKRSNKHFFFSLGFSRVSRPPCLHYRRELRWHVHSMVCTYALFFDYDIISYWILFIDRSRSHITASVLWFILLSSTFFSSASSSNSLLHYYLLLLLLILHLILILFHSWTSNDITLHIVTSQHSKAYEKS